MDAAEIAGLLGELGLSDDPDDYDESYCDNCPEQGDCDGEDCELAWNPMG